MKTQVVTNQQLSHNHFPTTTISTLGKPKSLDEFDVVIIDLSDGSIWRYAGNIPNTIDCMNDFRSIKQMVTRKNQAIVVYVLPNNQNYVFCSTSHMPRTMQIKDYLPTIIEFMKESFPPAKESYPLNLIYEPTRTQIDGFEYDADFYFDDNRKALSTSVSSKKTTTIQWSDTVFLTTLNVLRNETEVKAFLKTILPQKEKINIPEWMNGLSFFDDMRQKQIIEENKLAIEAANDNIEAAIKRLDENAIFESVLYTNGGELVEVVFSMLEKLLSCDLSEFEDENKEDFMIKKNSFTLIGEIKGVTSNVRSEHISQVDVHYQGYMDKLAEEELKENVHQVLIMNPIRNKPLSEREPVHDTQIKLAERNGCLIIETVTLLKLYEKFVAGEIDVATCEKLFTEKTGLLIESDFCDSAAT